MKRKVISLVLLGVVVLVMSIPGVFAFMFGKTQTLVNTFTPANVSCEIVESFDGKTKSSVQVQNTSNIAVYIRVCVVGHYVDPNGVPVALNAPTVNFAVGENWIKNTDGFYYYKYPIAPDDHDSEKIDDDITTNLLLGNWELPPRYVTDSNDEEFTYYPVIDIIAEAIQSVPDSAVEGNWPVTIQDNVERTLVASSS